MTRFLVPGTVICLMGLALAAAPAFSKQTSRLRRCAAAALLVVATIGPCIEFGVRFRAQWFAQSFADGPAQWFGLLARFKGPFY